mmetsp:Transcript_58037/g.66241  ORF Transcript_58037/g.66241 Transcript_58037/m.66241 type:complete len:249 (-) Transcript_58037:159-905(-)
MVKALDLYLNHAEYKTSQCICEEIVKRLDEGKVSNSDTPEELPNVRLLDLSRNFIRTRLVNEIAETLPQISTTMEELYLTANEMETIPHALKSFTSLRIAVLNSNRINSIDGIAEVLINNPHLTLLDLKTNRITDITGLVSHPNLESLSFSNNQITSIDSLPNFPKLKFIGLFGNFLGKHIDSSDKPQLKSCLSETLLLIKSRCPQLTQLCLDGNFFSQIDDYIPVVTESLPTLEYLDSIIIEENILR